MSREYVKDLMNIFGPDNEFYYHHKNNKKVLEDIDNLIYSSVPVENCDVNIDTWIGQNMSLGLYSGCNFKSYHNVMSKVYKDLNIFDKFKDIGYYIPSINYEKLNIYKIKEFFKKDKKYVLISNNFVLSGQAPNIPMNCLIEMLANNNPNIIFIATNSEEGKILKDNIIYCDDLTEKGFNLNEISYISTLCNVIVGRSSGAYSFSIVKENMNKDKSIVCFCNLEQDCWKCDGEENIIWSNNYDIGYMSYLIQKEIDKY